MGPKKPKKSKAELEEERLAREEEERKAKVLEEKKQAEEREKKRQEELRIAAEQKAFREKELQRWTEEYSEIVDELRGKEQQLNAEEKMEESRLEWLSYRDPSDEPDATVESDMSTFITLSREAHVQEMKEAIEWIRKIEKVAAAVEDVWSDSLAKHDERMKEKSYKNLVVLREMIMEKIDEATIPIIRFADKYLNDRAELNVEEVATNVGIGLWASYNDIRPIRKSVQLETLGIQLDIPKQILQQPERYVYRLVKIPLVSYNLEAYRPSSVQSLPNSDDEDMRRALAAKSKYVVGDIVQFDILISPPGAHHIRAKKWVLRDRSHHSNSLRKSAYPSSVASRMFIKVPDTVLLTDDLRIAVWDETHKDWTEEGISDYQYSESTRIVQFYITTVGLIALVKKRHTDMPLRSWSLFPVLTKPIHEYMEFRAANTQGSEAISIDTLAKQGYIRALNIVDNTPCTFEKHARLVIQTHTQDITIDFIDSKCYFIHPSTPVFQDLLGKPFSPGCLLKRLQRKGINLLPILLDFQLNSECKVKKDIVEREALQQIASVANSLDLYSSTEWNKTLNESQVGVLARESCVYTCPGEENEYECILVERDEVSMTYQNTPELGYAPGPDGIQYTLVLGNEYNKRSLYSTVPRPREITHLELPRTLTQRITPEAMDRIRRINPRFQKVIFIFLSLIRPFSQT